MCDRLENGTESNRQKTDMHIENDQQKGKVSFLRAIITGNGATTVLI